MDDKRTVKIEKNKLKVYWSIIVNLSMNEIVG